LPDYLQQSFCELDRTALLHSSNNREQLAGLDL
jgi:hypothetical protein